jgi:hypothetical protein
MLAIWLETAQRDSAEQTVATTFQAISDPLAVVSARAMLLTERWR